MIVNKDFKCPKCGGQMEMYEHYDHYDGWDLLQGQNYECMNCHDYTTQLRVRYRMIAYECSSDREDE